MLYVYEATIHKMPCCCVSGGRDDTEANIGVDTRMAVSEAVSYSVISLRQNR